MILARKIDREKNKYGVLKLFSTKNVYYIVTKRTYMYLQNKNEIKHCSVQYVRAFLPHFGWKFY